MENSIDISGLDKAEVLKALYDNAKPQGLGFLHFDPAPMNIEEARGIVGHGDGNSAGDYPIPEGDWTKFGRKQLYFDYFKGRVMKVDIGEDTLSVSGYNRDNGDGAAQKALAHLLSQ